MFSSITKKNQICVYNNTNYSLKVQCRNSDDTKSIGEYSVINANESAVVYKYGPIVDLDPYIIIYAYEGEELIKSVRFRSHSSNPWKATSWVVNKEEILEQKKGNQPNPDGRVIAWQQNREQEIALQRELDKMRETLATKEKTTKEQTEQIEELEKRLNTLKKDSIQDGKSGPCYRDNLASCGGSSRRSSYRFLSTTRTSTTIPPQPTTSNIGPVYK